VARNWEEYFAQATDVDFTPAPMLVEVAEQLAPGRALDLACGAGRNALYLASLGWHVVAVDASSSGIRLLREHAAARQLAIDTHVADLEKGEFAIEPGGYDMICDFLYLQRDLFPQIREGVRPGGVVAAEILLRDQKPHRYVLEPGELRAEFHGWKILFYSESTPAAHHRSTARIIARRA